MTMGPTLWGIPEGRNSKNKEMGACRTCLGDQIAMSRGPRARGRKRQKLKSENFMSGQFIKHLLGEGLETWRPKGGEFCLFCSLLYPQCLEK